MEGGYNESGSLKINVESNCSAETAAAARYNKRSWRNSSRLVESENNFAE